MKAGARSHHIHSGTSQERGLPCSSLHTLENWTWREVTLKNIIRGQEAVDDG